MRNGILFFLTVGFVSANLRADPIRYEQIPADAMSYLHFDVDRFLACRALKQFGAPADLPEKVVQMFGGKLASCTIYFFENENGVQTVMLVHADSGVRAKAEAFANRAKDKVLFKYESQDIYYSSEGLLAMAQATMTGLGQNQDEQPEPKGHGLFGGHGSFSLGVGDKPRRGDIDVLNAGPSYRAFVGQDLIVMTTDVRTISRALDVLNGKSPSLAKENPRGLKGDVPEGAIFLGAGLTAQVTGDNTSKSNNSSTRPATVMNTNGGAFGLDMFASFKGKAQLARFAIGEDAQSDYVDASILMTDDKVAAQLKSLMDGMKALVQLSQAAQAPLIEPLQIRTSGKEVGMHWSWPTDKLAELVKLAENDDDGSKATSLPNSNGSR